MSKEFLKTGITGHPSLCAVKVSDFSNEDAWVDMMDIPAFSWTTKPLGKTE